MLKLSFEGAFILISYECGHGLLLFRSNPYHARPDTRVDILFQDVIAMETRVFSDGLTIEEVGPELLESTRCKPADLIEGGRKTYSLSGRDTNGETWSGFVLAAKVTHCEDDLPYGSRSQLLGPELD